MGRTVRRQGRAVWEINNPEVVIQHWQSGILKVAGAPAVPQASARNKGHATDLREVLKVAEEIGLVIVPHADGRPRAYVIEATRAVNEWIQKEADSANPL
jgi:hypothetical protein